MKNKKHNLPKQVNRAQIDSKSINEEARTFEVVFATENPVLRRGWEENFYEILVCEKTAMRTQRMDNGVVPLLDNHDRYTGVKSQYGSLIEYKIEKGECRGIIQFSKRPELDGIWEDIKSGLIRGISASYIPWKYQREIVEGRKEPNYRAIDWEVTEISLAPVPADYMSKVRSEENQDNYEVEISSITIQNTNNNMKRTADILALVRAAGLGIEFAERLLADETVDVAKAETMIEEEKKRTQGQAPTTTPPPAPANNNPAPANNADAVKAERKRALDITNAVRAAKLDQPFADKLIADGVTIEEARAQIIDKLAESQPPASRTANTGTVTVDETEKKREAVIIGMMHRAQPGVVELKDQAHDFKYMTMLNVARHLLEMKGERVGGMSPSELVSRAISTTDFPLILGTTVQRFLRKEYGLMPQTWKQIANQMSAPDFREKTGIKVDGKITFEEMAEGSEYKETKFMQEESAKIKLATYGRKISITRQTIINDDLSVFNRIPKILARGAANFQADKVWGLIKTNAKTPDNVALFHATHGNLASGGGNVGAPSEDLLSKARIAMWKQTSPAGEQLGISPKYIIVPVEHLTTVQKLLTAITANATGSVNVFANAYEILTEPRLTNASEWYMAADPAQYEGLVYAYLEGQEGLYTETETDFSSDKVVTKARLDFAASVWDHRGWYKNPGA